MLHARDDYNRIQDPSNKIPDNEPVMLFRAQDKHFIAILEYYRLLVKADSGDPKILNATSNHIDLAKKWPIKKSPDMI